MTWIRIIKFLLFWLYLTNPILAQYSIGINQLTGKILKHSSRIIIEVPQTVYGFEAILGKRLNDHRPWQNHWGLPYFDIGFSYCNFNDNRLGSALGLSANLKFDFFQKRNVQLFLRSGTGLSYVSKIYDPISNEANNFISTRLNNISSLSIGPSLSLSTRWKLEGGISFTHYSNGGTHKPNKGINLYRGFIGLHYQFLDSDVEEKKPDIKTESIEFQKLGWMVQSSIGRSQIEPFYDQNFAIFSVSGYSMIRPNPFQSWLVGIEYEYNEGTKWYVEEIFKEDEEAKDAAQNLSMNIGHQLEFGRIVSRYMMGFYFEKAKWDRDAPFFFKLQTEYKHPINNQAIGVGISIKSHYFRAENISIFSSFYW